MTLRKDKTIRHFLNYHNPETMGYEFDEVGGGPGIDVELSIVTNKLVHDLAGDIVWLVGRRADRPTYYLYGRFRVAAQGPSEHDGFKYAVWGRGCHLLEPLALGRSKWFKALLAANPHLSLGFQRVRVELADSISAEFSTARRRQFTPTPDG